MGERRVMKSSKEIRDAFLNYFNGKGHSVVKSSSLVPANDPTLIFVNAGMVQFKDTFLGKEKRDYTRATTSQKCMRVSGKHNDLENVGRTARHHTLFEMLGNFSFGDYFKEDAIKYGWEFLTEVVKLDKEKLYITVYNDDDDAYDIWTQKMNIPKDKIMRLGEKDNFWSMGETGPCGPCSEIHIDQGEEMSCGENCGLGVCDCDRWLEIWNLVFMQYDRDISGRLTPLPNPSIDTGMGLERLTAILQGKKSNYDSDLFVPIIEKVAQLVKKSYTNNDEEDNVAMRVIADHARATTFLITDGVIPSNEARGYVLRRVMRRAIRFGTKLGFKELFFDKICEAVIDKMSDSYPELEKERETIVKIVRNEESKFRKTLIKGEKLLNSKIAELKKANKTVIDGETLFLLYDAYGFPIDLSELIAVEHGFTIDEKGFKHNLVKQKERSRSNQKVLKSNKEVEKLLEDFFKENGKTNFLGYDKMFSSGVLKAIIKDDSFSDEAIANEEDVYIFLTDQTPFYAESGGQVADSGIIKTDNAIARVLDVQKTKQGIFYHLVKVEKGIFKIEKEINLYVDNDIRKDIMKNHSAAHLLQAALKKIVGNHVHQEGSYVDKDKLRFDFNHFEGLSHATLQKIERDVNHNIMLNQKTYIKEMNIEEAKDSGAIALFNEKYGDTVRTVMITDDSFELCGGTHVERSGDIGFFKIVSENSVASGIRRIEAITGDRVLKMIHRQEDHERRVISLLKASKSTYMNKVDQLVKENKELNLKLENLKKEYNLLKLSSGGTKTEDGITIGENYLIFKVLDDVNPKDLKILADELKQKKDNSLVVLVSKSKKGYHILIMKANANKTHCGNTLKALMKTINGRGGGKDTMAQGGATLDKTPEEIKVELEKILKG